MELESGSERFCVPKTSFQENVLVNYVVRASTKYKNKYAVSIFAEWQWLRRGYTWRLFWRCLTRLFCQYLGHVSSRAKGAFHYAKDFGNLGRNSNGKIRFGFFWPEYSGSPLEVVHIFRSEYLPLLGNSVTKFKMTRAISIGWPDLIGKCRSIFLRYSHWSLTGQFGIMEAPLNLYGHYINYC